MSIKTRISLLLALHFGATLLMFNFLVFAGENEAAREHFWAEAELSRLVSRILRYTNSQLHQFSLSYKKWDELVEFVERPDAAWADANIDRPMNAAHIDRAWILRPDATLVHQFVRPGAGAANDNLPPAGELMRLFMARRYAYFSIRFPDGLYRLQSMPIVPLKASRTKSEPRGWLIVAHRWNDSYLRQFGELCEGEAAIGEPGAPAQGGPDPVIVRVRRPLMDAAGRIVAELVVARESAEFAERMVHERQELYLFILQGLLALLLVTVTLRRWVSMPFARITASLAAQDIAAIRPLLARQDEFGEMAQLLKSSLADREALQHALEARIRLARDLHDGVAQNIYAAGLALTVTRPLLRGNPVEAERIIDDTRARLNAIIQDLRDYIAGAEPAAKSWQTFSEAVRAIVEQVRFAGKADVAVEIDDQAVGRLSLHQRSQLLQIVRESTSNALRHAEAKHIRVSLQDTAAEVRLEVLDDGRGFDPADPTPSGNGLGNMRERAKIIGGSLEIDSALGRGTMISVTITTAVQ